MYAKRDPRASFELLFDEYQLAESREFIMKIRIYGYNLQFDRVSIVTGRLDQTNQQGIISQGRQESVISRPLIQETPKPPTPAHQGRAPMHAPNFPLVQSRQISGVFPMQKDSILPKQGNFVETRDYKDNGRQPEPILSNANTNIDTRGSKQPFAQVPESFPSFESRETKPRDRKSTRLNSSHG